MNDANAASNDDNRGTMSTVDRVDSTGALPLSVVGIGASAGGLESLKEFFSALRSGSGMAFVVVQHLDPRHASVLKDLLAQVTDQPVLEAIHGLPLQRNHVYIIPPNTTLTVGAGTLLLAPRPDTRTPHLPIDALFRSLAEDQETRAIGVILSGTGTDGTLGLCEIKAVGGISFAQDEATAAHPGMPRSAIESGCVDFVLAPRAIAERLTEICKHPYLGLRVPADDVEHAEDVHYKKILGLVYTQVAVDFSLYRDTTIRRRIMRRMALHAETSVVAYVERLEHDPSEIEALYQDLLINVTSFFRDPALFEVLQREVFPALMANRAPNAPVRVWVAGCSTGQEAYSLGMALTEFFDARPKSPPIHIFATDLSDERALAKARAGVYPDSIEAEVSPERLRRFFRKEENVYRIAKELREMCVFARHNVTTDPPFSRLDLISCRNVLIYLAPSLQKRLLPTFHYALNDSGVLVLGTAESIGEHADLFDEVDRTNKIYSKRQTIARPVMSFAASGSRGFEMAKGRHGAPFAPTQLEYQREADRMLLGRYSPPGVLIDENYNILQFRGKVGLFLEPPAGQPTTNLLDMAREGLFLDLRSVLSEVSTKRKAVRRASVHVRAADRMRTVQLEVLPVKPAGGGMGCFLVLFHEPDATGAEVAATPQEPGGGGANTATGLRAESEPDALAQLRQELVASKEYMQALAERQDAVNEELRSANEEIVSSNEELQSTNEELESAKEELQSLNEELTTVNEQQQHRNGELNLVNNDLSNLLASTTIPVVMIGGDLRVRRFTAAARKALRLVPSDVGRPIGDVCPAGLLPDLEPLIAEVIASAQPQERELHDADDRWMLMRLHPYRATDQKIDGVVMFLMDIDELKRAQTTLSESERELQAAFRTARLGRWSVDLKSGIGRYDRAACVHLGLNPNASEHSLDEFWARIDPRDNERVRAAMQVALEGHAEQFEYRVLTSTGEPRWLCSAFGIRGPIAKAVELFGISSDVTARNLVEGALRLADRRKDEFLALVSHELRNPLAPIRNALEIMRLAVDDTEVIDSARQVVERQVQQLSHIVEDLIDVTRIVEGKVTLRIDNFELKSAIMTVLETCRPTIEANRQRLGVSLPDTPMHLDADRTRITQVLINVLGNATKFTPPGGTLDLTVKLVEPNGAARLPPMVAIHVRDSGIGIAAEFLPRIFDLFTQVDSSVERMRGGLGIGLSLARRLVELHGGTIEARSAGLGQGSEFVIQLPLGTGQTPERDERDEHDSLMITKTRPLPRRRVLVVDDNADQVLTLGKLLELLGHEVRTARDGESAIELAGTFDPDIALIDIGLPLICGYEVARRLRADPRFDELLLIAQTGWGGDEERSRTAAAGFDHHLLKPIGLDELERVLASKRKKPVE